MDAELGNATDALSFLEARRAGSRTATTSTRRCDGSSVSTRIGRAGAMALRPSDEPMRLGQDPDLAFAPAPLASLDSAATARWPRLQVRLFGLLGPNGPLPLHLTEYVRHRLRHAGDPTLSRFLDIFHHRFIALFYRAWAQAQPHVNRDRPGHDRFRDLRRLVRGHRRRTRCATATACRISPGCFIPARSIRQVRNAEGLAAMLGDFFGVTARVEEFVAHWLVLELPTRTRLGLVRGLRPRATAPWSAAASGIGRASSASTSDR